MPRATQNFVMNATKIFVVYKTINFLSVKTIIVLFIVLLRKLFRGYQHQELFKPIQSHQIFVSQATDIKQTPFVRTYSTPVNVNITCTYLSVYS